VEEQDGVRQPAPRRLEEGWVGQQERRGENTGEQPGHALADPEEQGADERAVRHADAARDTQHGVGDLPAQRVGRTPECGEVVL